MVKVKVKTTKQVKKKFPIKFEAPDYLKNVILGESEITNLNLLKDAKIVLNLFFVTKNPRHQNIRMHFSMGDVNNGLAKTLFNKYEIVPYYLNRILRKGSHLIEDVFDVLSKDNFRIRYKIYVISKNKVSSELRTIIRKDIRKILNDYTAKVSSQDVFVDAINNVLQNQLRASVKKLILVKALDFKKIEIRKK